MSLSKGNIYMADLPGKRMPVPSRAYRAPERRHLRFADIKYCSLDFLKNQARPEKKKVNRCSRTEISYFLTSLAATVPLLHTTYPVMPDKQETKQGTSAARDPPLHPTLGKMACPAQNPREQKLPMAPGTQRSLAQTSPRRSHHPRHQHRC